MVQVLPQSDFGADLGATLGSGVSDALKLLVQAKAQSMKQSAAPPKPFNVFETQGLLKKTGLSPEVVNLLSGEELSSISNRANELLPQKGRDEAFLQASEEILNPQKGTEEQVTVREVPGLFSRGFQSGIAGRLAAISQGESKEDYEKRVGLQEEEGFLKDLLHSSSRLAADSPFYALGAAGGGALGSAVPGIGTAIGGGAGAFGLQSFLDSALKEYHDFVSEGGDLTFEEFLQRAGKVGKETATGAGEGALFGYLEGLQLLRKIPGIEKILKSKPGKALEKVGDVALTAGGLTAGSAALRGEAPTREDYAKNLALLGGFKFLNKGAKYGKQIYQDLKKSGLSPQDAASRLQEKSAQKGYDLDNPADAVRAVKEITAEATPQGDIVAETVQETPIESPRQVAEALAERPIQDYLEAEAKRKAAREKIPTEKEQAKRALAREQLKEVQAERTRVNNEIERINRTLEAPENPLSGAERGAKHLELFNKERESRDLTREIENLRSLAEKGKTPFREGDIKEAADKRVKELTRLAEQGVPEELSKVEEAFKKDRRHIDEALKIAAKEGSLPQGAYKDIYTRSLEPYQKAYKDQIKKVEQSIKEAPTPALKKELELLKKNLDINEAKLLKQKDKLDSLHNLKKPGSSLVKQVLKDLRKDIPEIQKDYVKALKKGDALASKVTPKLFKESAPYLKDAAKLSEPRTHQLSKKLGISAEQVKSTQNKAQSFAQEITDSLKTGKITPEILKKSKEFMLGGSPKVQAFKRGILLGGVQAAVEGMFDIKVPVTTLSFLLPGTTAQRASRAVGTWVFNLGKKLLKKGGTALERKRFQNAKSRSEQDKIVKELIAKKWKAARIKKVTRG